MSLFWWLAAWVGASLLVCAGWCLRVRFEPSSHADMRRQRDELERYNAELEGLVQSMSGRTAETIDAAIEKLLGDS